MLVTIFLRGVSELNIKETCHVEHLSAFMINFDRNFTCLIRVVNYLSSSNRKISYPAFYNKIISNSWMFFESATTPFYTFELRMSSILALTPVSD
jgi:hypothetical protein